MSDLRVIGAGLGRTGTVSLHFALELLGLGPCHHLAGAGMEHKHELLAGMARDDLDSINDFWAGYVSAVDVPARYHYKTLLKTNPGLKVILTLRESAEKWAVSARNTVFNKSANPLYGGLVYFVSHYMMKPNMMVSIRKHMVEVYPKRHGVGWEEMFEGTMDYAKFYNDWIEDVKNTVPSDQLLIFTASDGWGPLCEFLNVPVPDVPYPRANNTEGFKEGAKAAARSVFKGGWEVVKEYATPVVLGAVVTAAALWLAAAEG